MKKKTAENALEIPPIMMPPEPGIPENWMRISVLFLAGQIISLFGSSLVEFAIIWYITLTTKSGAMMMIATLCGFLPQLLISIFAGVLADRYPRKRLILLADAGIAMATLILAILFLAGFRETGLLFVILVVRSMGTGIQTPSVSAIIPQLVPKENLLKINGIYESGNSLILLISPVLSGVLLTVSSLEYVFFIDVGTAAVAIAILLSLKIRPHYKATQKSTTGYFQDLTDGLKYIRAHALIKMILIFYAVFFFLIVPVAILTPLMVTRSFGPEVWRLTANEMAFFAGSLLGGILVSVRGGGKNHFSTIVASCIAFGVLNALMGLAPSFFLYLIFMFLSGILVPYFSTAITVILQKKVEQQMQGRVFSFLQLVTTAVMPLGMMVFGPASDLVSIEILLIITGVMISVLGIAIHLSRAVSLFNIVPGSDTTDTTDRLHQ